MKGKSAVGSSQPAKQPRSARLKLIERLGVEEGGSQSVRICGRRTEIYFYDWYIEHALHELQFAVDAHGIVKFKSVDYDFVVRFRHAIRENYNQGHNLPDTGFTRLHEIKSFIEIIDRIEELHVASILRE
jgi:hypothetical protein